MKKTDIVICAMPALFVDRAPGAPAILKAAANEAGYSAVALDLSLSFLIEQCNRNLDKFNELGCVFRPGEKASIESLMHADQWVKESIKKIKQHNPTLVGISVFTNFQHRSTIMLAKAIRHHMPDVKIVLGGFGLTISCQSLVMDADIRKIDIIKNFGQYMQDKNLTDYNVFGSGLDELINILQTEVGPRQHVDYQSESDLVIYNAPIPNYDNYQLTEYIWNQGIALPVTGSKGCVRACTFCDIPGQFGKFKYRTGKDIAKEMIHLHKKYQVNIFEFTDSLVNGSFKAFREWLEIIADYNDTQQESDKIRWFGQYICRPQAHTPADIYPLMKRAGVQNLVIGLESGSNDVLAAMKKKMTVQDAFDEFKMFESVGINVHVLMLSGYYNETWDRFVETLEFIVNLRQYVASGTISHLSMGLPLFINDKMYLGDHSEQLGIIRDPSDDLYWKSSDHPENTFIERARRRLIAQLVLDKLKIQIGGHSILNLHQLKERIKKLLPDSYVPANDTPMDLDFLIPEKILKKINSNKVTVALTLDAESARGVYPRVKVILNDRLLADQQIKDSETIVIDTTVTDARANLILEYYGKTPDDTVTKDGIIIENQNIKITKLTLNGVDILKSNTYTHLGAYHMYLDDAKISYYKTHGFNTGPSHSLQMFENGYWQFKFDMPVLQNLISIHAHPEIHGANWPDLKLLTNIYDLINAVQEIEELTTIEE